MSDEEAVKNVNEGTSIKLKGSTSPKVAENDMGLTFLDYNEEQADGGYHDTCNSLLNQIKQVERMYRDQLKGLKGRREDLKQEIKSDIKAVIICIVTVIMLVVFVKVCEKIMIDGVLLMIYAVVKIFLPAVALVVLCFINTFYIKKLLFDVKKNNIMNETLEAVNRSNVITFKQEEAFLKKKLYDIEIARDAHKSVDREYQGKFSDEWDDKITNDVQRLRSVSIFKEYYAHGVEKGSAAGQMVIPLVVTLMVGIPLVVFLFA